MGAHAGHCIGTSRAQNAIDERTHGLLTSHTRTRTWFVYHFHFAWNKQRELNCIKNRYIHMHVMSANVSQRISHHLRWRRRRRRRRRWKMERANVMISLLFFEMCKVKCWRRKEKKKKKKPEQEFENKNISISFRCFGRFFSPALSALLVLVCASIYSSLAFLFYHNCVGWGWFHRRRKKKFE